MTLASSRCLSCIAILLLVGCGGGEMRSPDPQPQPDSALSNPSPADRGSQAAPDRPQNVESEASPRNGPPVTEAPQLLSEEELAEGWVRLFDGETLFGWSAASNADWRVEDGAIVVSEGEKGLLVTTTQFANYVLRLEFKADAETNSGVFLRTPAKPQAPDKDCYELNIAPGDNPFPTGSLVGRKKVEGESSDAGWRTYEVTLDGPVVVVNLDGRELLRYQDPAPLQRGHIGLQLNEGRVAFRNIALRPLGLASIFDGQGLTGWSVPESESTFSATEQGELHVQNGRGHIESDGRYGDFVLQLECKTNAPELNSGIFFRCVPGSIMDGYESQIHNGFKDGDRRQPVDYGSGGIFRRQEARLVVANDQAWFYKTIIADGPHMAVWVNGYQVSDWVDTRAADDNPRRGLRTEAGTIMIQGHDPTTDLLFRKLRIGEMPQ